MVCNTFLYEISKRLQYVGLYHVTLFTLKEHSLGMTDPGRSFVQIGSSFIHISKGSVLKDTIPKG